MKVYRMCHLPSGLFFCPSREIKVKAKDINGQERQIYVKSNLSKKGKIYLILVSSLSHGHLEMTVMIKEYDLPYSSSYSLVMSGDLTQIVGQNKLGFWDEVL